MKTKMKSIKITSEVYHRLVTDKKNNGYSSLSVVISKLYEYKESSEHHE